MRFHTCDQNQTLRCSNGACTTVLSKSWSIVWGKLIVRLQLHLLSVWSRTLLSTQGNLQSCLVLHGTQLTAFLTKTQQAKKESKKQFTSSYVFFPSCPLLLLEIPKHKSHDEGSIPFALQGCALKCIQPFVWAAETVTGTGMWGEGTSP